MARRQHTALAALAETPTLHLVHVPDETASAATRRYGVDIESHYHGRCARFYVDGDEPETVLLGFAYSTLGELVEWTDSDEAPIANCASCSIGEAERAGGPDLWKGPLELPEKAKQAGFHVIYRAKDAKDHCYLRVFPYSPLGPAAVHEMFFWR